MGRRNSYERYLKLLINRVDLRSSELFREFIQVKGRVRRLHVHSPIQVAKVDAELSFKDFIYLPEHGLLISAMNQKSLVKRLDSYLTNIWLPWDCCRGTRNKGHNNAIYAPVGAVALSKVSQVDGKWTIKRLWVKNFG